MGNPFVFFVTISHTPTTKFDRQYPTFPWTTPISFVSLVPAKTQHGQKSNKHIYYSEDYAPLWFPRTVFFLVLLSGTRLGIVPVANALFCCRLSGRFLAIFAIENGHNVSKTLKSTVPHPHARTKTFLRIHMYMFPWTQIPPRTQFPPRSIALAPFCDNRRQQC